MRNAQDLLQAGVLKYQADPVFRQKMLELTSQQREVGRLRA